MSDEPHRFRDSLSRPHDLDLVWWVLPAALTAIGFGLLPLRSWDYWWHITMGRLIDAWGAVPAANHYLYTLKPEAPSFIQPWLAEWLLYAIHAVAPVYGGLVVRNLLVTGVVCWLTAVAIRRARAPLPGSVTVLVGVFFLTGIVELRPHLFALPLFVASLTTVRAVRSDSLAIGYAPPIFLGLGCAWANLHGSFPLAVVVALIAGGAAAVRSTLDEGPFDFVRPAVWFGSGTAAALGTLINPRTTGVWRYVIDVAGSIEARRTVTEWWPTYLWAPHGLGTLFWLSVAAGLAAVIYQWRRSRDIDALDVLVAAAFAALAALQRRSLLWWGVVFPWALSPYVGAFWRDLDAASKQPADESEPGRLPTVLAAVLVGLGLLVQPTWQWRVDLAAAAGLHDVRREAPMKGVVPADLPVEATHYLRRSGRPRVFHAQKYAGYILYRLTDEHPAQRVFVDHRIELPDREIWNRFRRTSLGKDWQRTFKAYAIRGALLNRQTQGPLVEKIEQADGWKRIYTRADHVLFVAADR